MEILPKVYFNSASNFEINFSVEVNKTVMSFNGTYEKMPEFFASFSWDISTKICGILAEILYRQGKIFPANKVSSVAVSLPVFFMDYGDTKKEDPTP